MLFGLCYALGMGVTLEEMNKASNPVPLAGLAPDHGLTKDRILAKFNRLLDAKKPQIVKARGIFAPWGDDDLPGNARVVMRTSEEAVVEFTYDDGQLQLAAAKTVAEFPDWKPAQKVELTNDIDEWFEKVFNMVANSNKGKLPREEAGLKSLESGGEDHGPTGS